MSQRNMMDSMGAKIQFKRASQGQKYVNVEYTSHNL